MYVPLFINLDVCWGCFFGKQRLLFDLHKLCATFSSSVNINYRLPIKAYYRICTLRHIRIEINHVNKAKERGHVRMSIQSVPITTNVVSSNPARIIRCPRYNIM
jgi:hypothetical protein